MANPQGKQVERLLRYLKSGKTIDGMKSWDVLGIYRLASRIYDLRVAGWNIQYRWISGRNRWKEKVKWKQYYMVRGNWYLED